MSRIHEILKEEEDTAGETRGNIFGRRRRGVRANSVRRGDLYSSLAHEDSHEDLRCRIRCGKRHHPAGKTFANGHVRSSILLLEVRLAWNLSDLNSARLEGSKIRKSFAFGDDEQDFL